MNGAEIVEGSAIKVEPSDPMYKAKNTTYGPTSVGLPENAHLASVSHPTNLKRAEEDKADTNQHSESEPNSEGAKDEDLEDFFESLL